MHGAAEAAFLRLPCPEILAVPVQKAQYAFEPHLVAQISKF